MQTISIKSGFQRGGSLLSWDGANFVNVQRASENTWVDDGDSSFSTQVPDDFKGAVTHFWGISAHSYCNSAELMGFSEEELKVPSPVKGWASCQGSCVRSTDDWRLDTMADYLTALARGASIFTVVEAMEKGEKHPSGNGNVLVHLGYEAGDQDAAAFAVLDKDGKILSEVSGCGDRTPCPIETVDGWEFSTSREEQMREQDEYNRAFDAAAEKLGLLEEYRWVVANYSERNNARCDVLARKIMNEVTKTAADARAKADETGILRRLLDHYRSRMNPLRSLRQEKGGTWEYRRYEPTNLPADVVVFYGDNWWVIWAK